jgi:hypothetical protein
MVMNIGCSQMGNVGRQSEEVLMDTADKIQRREFLVRLSLLTAGAATTFAPHRLAAAPRNMTDLTATAAVEAMRNGDMKAEDYAQALLDRAQALANLNAFRTLNRDMILEASGAQHGSFLGNMVGCDPTPFTGRGMATRTRLTAPVQWMRVFQT